MNIKYAIIRLALNILGAMPISVARRLGAGIAKITLLFNTRQKRTTLINIQACLPALSTEKQRALMRNSMIETGKLGFEMCAVWKADTAEIKKRIIATHGEHYLNVAAASGRGVIIIAPHIGNWEVLGQLLPTYGPVTSMYQPPKQIAIEAFVKQSREASGSRLVPTSQRGVAMLLKRLKQGEITGILPDQVPDEGSGSHSTFFGIPTYTMTLVHGLIKRTQCHVIMGAAIRHDKGFKLIFEELDGAIHSEDLAISLKGMNSAIESLVNRYPEQYQWEYKRFKKQPKGCSGRVDYN